LSRKESNQHESGRQTELDKRLLLTIWSGILLFRLLKSVDRQFLLFAIYSSYTQSSIILILILRKNNKYIEGGWGWVWLGKESVWCFGLRQRGWSPQDLPLSSPSLTLTPSSRLSIRCNGYWECANGQDELDCSSYSLVNRVHVPTLLRKLKGCGPDEHFCLHVKSDSEHAMLSCISVTRAGNGNIDCCSATNECNNACNDTGTSVGPYLYRCSGNSIVCVSILDICNSIVVVVHKCFV
jgi:hypothetical protein